MARSYKQGFFKPKSPEKYSGDHTKIVFRSSWEWSFMTWCDRNPSILEWSSEEFHIPYYYSVDEKMHRYFVDFKIKIKTPQGVFVFLIEIKPLAQIQRPKAPKKQTKKALSSYEEQIKEWVKNQEKWEAASKYALDRGWGFKVLSEHELFPNGVK